MRLFRLLTKTRTWKKLKNIGKSVWTFSFLWRKQKGSIRPRFWNCLDQTQPISSMWTLKCWLLKKRKHWSLLPKHTVKWWLLEENIGTYYQNIQWNDDCYKKTVEPISKTYSEMMTIRRKHWSLFSWWCFVVCSRNLSNNEISIIEPGAFEGLQNLRHLWVLFPSCMAG